MTLFKRLFGPAVSDDEILTAMDPWTLACAVGAENGTIGVRMGFEWWLGSAQKNFAPEVAAKLGVSEGRIVRVLRGYVEANQNRHYHRG